MGQVGPIWSWAGALLGGAGAAVALREGLGGPAPLLVALGVSMVAWRVRGSGRPGEWALAAALAVLAAARADAAIPTAGEVDLHGRVTSPWRARGSMAMAGARGSVRLLVDPGVLRRGDVVRVLESRPGRQPAAAPLSTELGTLSRPAELAPRPEELLRERSGAEGGGAGLARALRARGLEACARHPDRDTSALLAALLFGDTTRLPRGMADLFTRTGTRHLLALSGLHVALMAALIGVPLARAASALVNLALRAAGITRLLGPAVLLALLAAFFVPLSGSGAPATRASLALACAALGPRLGVPRRPRALDLLGLALAIEVLVDPLAPVRPGVQLSYLATAALVAVAPRGAPRVAAALPLLDPPAEVRRSGRRRLPMARALHLGATRLLGLGIGASVVATLATLPVVWGVFGEVSWAGVLLTTLSMPAVTALIGLGWAWIAAPALVPHEPLAWCAAGLVELLVAADHLPGTPLPLPMRPLWSIALASGLALLALRSGWSTAGRAATLVFGVLIAPLPVGAARPPETLEVHVVDVGDGTAIVARAPGASPLLVDAGSRDRFGVARAAVGPLLRALDAGRLRVVLTHDHADHARDLPWLARRFGVERWIGPLPRVDGGRCLGPAPWEGADRAVERGAAPWLRALRGGDFPGNEGSLVVELTCPTTGERVVLSGDAEGPGLAGLLRRGGLEPGPVAALLLPHHGSRSPHLGRLLDHLRPREVWVSASRVPPAAARECRRRGIPLRVTGNGGPWTWRAAPRGPGDVLRQIRAD